MLGFPAWPSFIMPSEMIPKPILKVQKKSTTFCVIFIPDGDYNWMTEKQLEALSKDKIDTRLSKVPKGKLKKQKGGRTKNINDALKAARDLSFDDFMDLLERRRNGEEDEDDDDDEEEEEEEEEQDQGEEVPQEDSEQEEQPEDKHAVKDESNGNQAESLKDDKSKQEEASEADGEDEDEEEEIRASKRTRNSNGSRKVAKTAKIFNQKFNGDTKIKDENETNGKKPTATSKALTEEEKQHQLWLCRIKLQRSLIQRNQPVTPTNTKQYPPPTVDELSVARLILHRLVEFPVSVELLKKTKIHKVLKCIIRDEDLEYPDSFKLHEKCEELLTKWNSLIEALKLEKLVKSMNHTSKDKQTENGVNKLVSKLHDSESRVSSQAPEESEISAVENSEILDKKNYHVDKASSSDEDLIKKDAPVAAAPVEG